MKDQNKYQENSLSSSSTPLSTIDSSPSQPISFSINNFHLKKIYKNVYKLRLNQYDNDKIIEKCHHRKVTQEIYSLSSSSWLLDNFNDIKNYYGNNRNEEINENLSSGSRNQPVSSISFPCSLKRSKRNMYALKLSKKVSSIYKELSVINTLQRPIITEGLTNEVIELAINGSKYVVNYAPFLLSLPFSSLENKERIEEVEEEEKERKSYKLGMIMNYKRHYINAYDYIIRLKNTLSASTTVKLLQKMLYLLSFLHLSGVSHGDIKLNNFLLCIPLEDPDKVDESEPDILLIDFDHAFIKNKIENERKDYVESLIFDYEKEKSVLENIQVKFSIQFLKFYNESEDSMRIEEVATSCSFSSLNSPHSLSVNFSQYSINMLKNQEVLTKFSQFIESFELIMNNLVELNDFSSKALDLYSPYDKKKDYSAYKTFFDIYDQFVKDNKSIIIYLKKLTVKRSWMKGGTFSYLTKEVMEYNMKSFAPLLDQYISLFSKFSGNHNLIIHYHQNYLKDEYEPQLFLYIKQSVKLMISNSRILPQLVRLYYQYHYNNENSNNKLSVNFIAKTEFYYTDFEYYCYRDLWTIGMVLYELVTNTPLLWTDFKKENKHQELDLHDCGKQWCYWNNSDFHLCCPLIYEKYDEKYEIEECFDSPVFNSFNIFKYLSKYEENYYNCDCYIQNLKRRKKLHDKYNNQFNGEEYVSEAKLLHYNLLKKERNLYYFLEKLLLLILNNNKKNPFSSIFILRNIFPHIELVFQFPLNINEKLNFLLNNPNFIDDDVEYD